MIATGITPSQWRQRTLAAAISFVLTSAGLVITFLTNRLLERQFLANALFSGFGVYQVRSGNILKSQTHGLEQSDRA